MVNIRDLLQIPNPKRESIYIKQIKLSIGGLELNSALVESKFLFCILLFYLDLVFWGMFKDCQWELHNNNNKNIYKVNSSIRYII